MYLHLITDLNIFWYFQGRPTLLESQFRLTYTMILNLLKVEQLRVEDMMKRSFSEFHTQKDDKKYKEMLEELSKKVDELQPIDCFMYCSDIEDYYSACKAYQSLKVELQVIVSSHAWYTINTGDTRNQTHQG